MKKIFIILLVAVIGLIFCGCEHEKEIYNYDYFDEWISPDGVHYWYCEKVNGYSYLAPRYGHDGNLVID